MLQPFLKWAGGKRQLLSQFEPYLPILGEENTYYEPFVGAGAMLFHLQPKRAIANDINSELINVYNVIKSDNKTFELLIEKLKYHAEHHNKEHFYEIREWDRTEEYAKYSFIDRAARFIYLNKTCFNGLYRVNSKGQFNVPCGKYVKPDIVNEVVLRDVRKYLTDIENKIEFLNKDFKEIVNNAIKDDFIYFDPPYDPLNQTSSFTSYASNGFGKNEQLQLREVFKELDDRGCKVLLSNSDTPFIREIYSDFEIVTVQANRAINAKGQGRGRINEILVLGKNSK